MEQSHDQNWEIRALRERLIRLSEASLRINESLDFDTVLQEVLDSARSLTDARYGVITLMDDSGRVQNFLSSGMTAEEDRRLWVVPNALQLFEYLSSISEPLRVADLLGHIRSMGLPEFRPPLSVEPAISFLAAPVFHHNQRVGNIYVAGKQNLHEFTQEDEETMVMFASQAAMVIANAHRYREEQRARADLEALVNTAPVGVVVFDARTGVPVSFNREAIRIVDSLRKQDETPEQLLDILTFRREDGREFSLREFPMAQLLSTGETVRAEEIVMGVPDGRTVTTLLNATPILSEQGEVESFVVTLQDMTPLEEMEQLRAEFLGMVSHELRTPLAAIKGSITILLEAASELDPAEMTQFFRIIQDQSDHMRYLIGDLLDVARIETGTLPIDPVPCDPYMLVDEAKSRFLGSGGRDDLQLELATDLPHILADRRSILQVLDNLLSNAVSYSAREAPIRVNVVRDGLYVVIAVIDEGRGIPSEQLSHLFRKFSRADGFGHGASVDGSGLGLAICKGIVEAHGGRIWAESDGPGLGARFTFSIPAAEVEGTRGDYPMRGLRAAEKGKLRVLVVDDDPQAMRYLRDVLTKSGYAPTVTGDPADVPSLMANEKPDLVLLDMMLPGTDGIELMNDILKTANIPVIFISVYGQDEFVARAFEMGATDYVVKPFSPTELVARIKAALRKSLEPNRSTPSEPYMVEDLTINYSHHQVYVAGELVRLTATEYSLLCELAANSPRTLTHDMLLHRIWGQGRAGESWLVRDVVKRLRRKLNDDATNPRYIFTAPRMGYNMPAGN